MKTIYFTRHAKSSWSSNASKDIDRPLNKRGKRDAPFMANLLLDKKVKIDGIIKSPAQRITETVAPFVKALQLTNNQIITERSIYEGSMFDLLDIVHSAPEDWNTIMIFGHNPAMTYIAGHFGGNDISNVPTLGILQVDSGASEWTSVNASNSKISAFYYPKMYFND